MMEQKPGIVIIELDSGETTGCIEVTDWWWENNLLVLRSTDGKRRYYNRERINYLSVPDMKTV